jgi:hypothetical protein
MAMLAASGRALANRGLYIKSIKHTYNDNRYSVVQRHSTVVLKGRGARLEVAHEIVGILAGAHIRAKVLAPKLKHIAVRAWGIEGHMKLGPTAEAVISSHR